LVAELTTRLDELSKAVSAPQPTSDTAQQKALLQYEAQLRKIQEGWATVTLRAPIDGIVTAILRRPGETVVQGEPIVIITATVPEKIVGYLRQPFPLEPQVGMEVQVRSNSRARSIGTAQLTRVGQHFEPIVNPVLHPLPTPEVGLPIEVSMPAGLTLRPGELVSLVIKPKTDS
jgi:multidrug resistance efflux pump